MPVTVITDRKWKQFKYRSDVPAKVLADRFDWLDDEIEDGFFCYRGYWHHTSEFMSVTGMVDLAGWHGYSSDSYFSGVLIKLSRDGEEYMVGRYYS